MSDLFTILAAATNSRKFAPLIAGAEIDLQGGRRVRAKIVATYRLQMLPGLSLSKFSFKTDIQLDQYNSCSGYGDSDYEIVAIQKSIAEALERALFTYFKPTNPEFRNTNGWATHINYKGAMQKSLEEILERDSVLIHWLTQTPMRCLEEKSYPKWLSKWVDNEFTHGEIYKTIHIFHSTLGFLPALTAVLLDEDDHFVMGHAVDSNIENAMRKAINEACHLAHAAANREYFESSKGLLEIRVGTALKPEDHGMVYAHHLPLPNWVLGETVSLDEIKSYWKRIYRDFSIKNLDFEFHPLTKSPLVVGYGRCPIAQSLFIGPTTDAIKNGLVNFKRLESLNISLENINLAPHWVA